jgi:hypothetical protein
VDEGLVNPKQFSGFLSKIQSYLTLTNHDPQVVGSTFATVLFQAVPCGDNVGLAINGGSTNKDKDFGVPDTFQDGGLVRKFIGSSDPTPVDPGHPLVVICVVIDFIVASQIIRIRQLHFR